MTEPLVIHVVDHDHKRRAQIAHCAFALGHHAEVYSDTDELAAFLPEDGVIIALEDAVAGGVGELVGLLNREGRWLAVVASSTDATLEKAVAAVRQGAIDYLQLPADPERLARTIANAANEASTNGERWRRRIAARRQLDGLSQRERDVLGLVAKGLTNKEAAARLGISPRTVEIHRNNALGKIGARNTVDAVRIWLETGIEAQAAAQTDALRMAS